ncbi:MAG: ribosomal RNA small subunit methyltransferase A [Planctomycetes bacterium]|nr:ribosomal RNA small subunit methyltransferase A [Planctomycetota bacterium]
MKNSDAEAGRLPRTGRELQAFLRAHGVRPRRRLGQNFMVDPNLVAFVVRAAHLAAGDRVLEIGTGTGVLTEALAAQGAEVVTVEADPRLYALVAGRLGQGVSVRAICADALATKHRLSAEVEAVLQAWGPGGYHVVANLPYSIAAALLVNLLRHPARPRALVVTVQREVADRLLSPAGTSSYGRLGVEVQLRARVARLRDVPPEVFWPRPEVQSSVVDIVPFPEGMRPAPADETAFSRFLKQVFGQRRKRLTAVFRDHRPAVVRFLEEQGLKASTRGEVLDPGQLVKAFAALSAGDAEKGPVADPQGPKA